MFVTDADTFRELTGKAFKEKIENIEIVNLIALNEKTWMAGTSPAMTVHQKSEAADTISIALRLR